MKKIILLVIIILFIGSAAYLIYLNEKVLPQKIKALLIAGLEESTGKRVTISSAKIDLFRGLVIKDLAILDDNSGILAAKEISCRFLIIPIFKKEVVLTAIKLDSPRILLERLPDNSINIVELFFKKPITLMDGKLGLTISRIIVSRGRISFKDDTFAEPFTKDLENANIDVRLNLPGKVVFNADFTIPSKVLMAVKSSGEYMPAKKELSARIEAKDFYPKEFAGYCDEKKFNIPDGRIDADLKLDYKDNILEADARVSGIEMKFSQIPVEAILNAEINAKIKYNLSNKELAYTGTASVKNLALYNLGIVDKIYDIRGNASFSDKYFEFNDITATVLGLPVEAHAKISDTQKPVLMIDASCDVKLEVLKNILKEKFGIDLPLEMAGDGSLDITVRYAGQETVFSGSLDVEDAVFRAGYTSAPLEGVTGKFDFTQNQLIFKDLQFKCNNTGYEASGTITNFQIPGVQLKFSSARMRADALFSMSGKTVILSALKGHYNDYGFSVQGSVDSADPKNLTADLSGAITFDLSEDKEPYKNFKDKFKDLKPSGAVNMSFTLKGPVNDISKCLIDAEVKCNKLSLGNFKFNDFISHFTQRKSVANIEYIRSSLYGGSIEGNGLVDLASKDTPYQINAELKGVRIEDLKKDTALKDKEISGIINTRFGIKGFLQDPSRFSAWGKINISKGKLWQLNLFKGIGALLLKSDFNSVLFEDGSCDFSIKDKSFYTNNLVMKSSLINLYGTVKVSFDKAVAASLRAEFTDEGVGAARTTGIAGAIERYSVIEVKGTLDDPKYTLRPDLGNVMSDIADNFFRQQ